MIQLSTCTVVAATLAMFGDRQSRILERGLRNQFANRLALAAESLPRATRSVPWIAAF
jgi:hypothetical protein